MFTRKYLILLLTAFWIVICIHSVDADSDIQMTSTPVDFTLNYLNSQKIFTLSDNKGKKPTVLIFGSYTCPMFRNQSKELERMYKEYGKKADFKIIYIREAHPTDGWRLVGNDQQGIIYQDPKTIAEREKIASDCVKALQITIPVLIDVMVGYDTDRKYLAWPDRIFIVDKEGKFVFVGEHGPKGFKPLDAEKVLKELVK